MQDSGASTSLWMAGNPLPRTRPLDADVDTDVCVVGAGVAGMTAALLLARAGKRVVVLEDGAVGGGMSARSTAHLSNALDDRYHVLERLHGVDGARLAASSHTHAISRIEEIARTEEIDCDFERVDGYLIAPRGGGVTLLMRECDAAVRAGLIDVSLVERAPFSDFDSGPALCFPRQGQLHPLKYVAGLLSACARRGVRVHTDTHAETFDPDDVRTRSGHRVRCRDLIVATNSPVIDRVTIHTKQHPWITYVVGALVPRGSVPRVLCWDTLDPYHYVRVHAGRAAPEQPAWDVLLVGGEDHRVGMAEDGTQRYARLEAWMRERFPMAAEVVHRWSGQILEPVDGLAYIGHNPTFGEHVYVITGDSGNGMTHATIGGIIISDMLTGLHNPWSVLYDPSRISMRAAGEWAREGLTMASHYGDWVTGGDVDTVDDIPCGQGAIVRRGLTKVAAWRRDDGTLVERSAVCPHLGGIVRWNPSESTWDCPCHGARFTAEGHVFQGPANHDLAEVERHAPLEP